MSDSEITTAEQEVIRNLLAEPLPLTGITIDYDPPDSYPISPPLPSDIDLSDSAVIAFAKEEFGVGDDTFEGETRQSKIDEARREKGDKYIGGFGITSRSLDDVREDIPTIDEFISQARGKVVILGNGFSSLALEFARLHKEGKLSEPPVVVDIFDYNDAERDFTNLRERFAGQRISFPFSSESTNLTDIVTAQNDGHLSCIKYLIGAGNPPREMLQADLVINSWGPKENSLGEQLSLLKVGGKFVTNRDLRSSSLGSGFNLRSIPNSRTNSTASIITKIQ